MEGNLRLAADALLEKARQWHAHPSPVWGLPTGFPSIDKLTGGLHGSHLIVFGADTGTGKSSWAAQVAITAAEHLLEESQEQGELTGTILLYTPEMTAEQLVMRLACQIVGVDSLDVHQGKLTDEEFAQFEEAVDGVAYLNSVFIVNDNPEIGVRDIVEDVEDQNRHGAPVRLVIIDYLQMLDLGTLSGNRYVGVSESIKQLKALANRNEIPVVVLSQLNREFKRRLQEAERDKNKNPHDVEPDLDDLSESGRIGQLADLAFLAWKLEDLSRVHMGREQTVYIKIAKNRHGPRQVVQLGFNPILTRYSDPEDYD